MPKERRARSVSIDRSRPSPYPCSSSRTERSSSKSPLENGEIIKEWEDARCPVCMEHPHNAVLLICSSHEKGCRPYMCDTSYRHSNCLDQFRKSFSETPSSTQQQGENPLSTANITPSVDSEVTAIDMLEEQGDEQSLTQHMISCENQVKSKLVCPLCRGQIKEWIVVEPARRFMNAKPRNCACETCTFNGTYTDLRKHARVEHPFVRPSEADPERQRNWRRMERQRDLGDLLSTLQSSFGEERGDDSILPMDEGGWLTVLFFIRVFRPGSSPRSTSWPVASRTRAQLSMRRSSLLWGESYDGETGSSSRDEDNDSSDSGVVPLIRRRPLRRRRTPDSQQ